MSDPHILPDDTCICPACDGSGYGVASTECGFCGGSGGVPFSALKAFDEAEDRERKRWGYQT